jgi:hypothetical protein
MIDIEVREHGPIFDGRAQRALDDAVHAIVEEVARVGKNDVLARLGRVIRNPTPYYETRIRTDKVTADRWLINDGPSTFKYGPWLEGTGSRNAPRTRFAGYHTFAIVARQLDAKATSIGDRVIARYLPDMQ